MQRIIFEGCECIVAAPEDIEALERELAEARERKDGYLKEIRDAWADRDKRVAQAEIDRDAERARCIKAIRKQCEKCELGIGHAHCRICTLSKIITVIKSGKQINIAAKGGEVKP